MAKVNKISSFKSFTEVRKQDTVMKLREENELKRKESVSKLATILDEMGLTSFEGLEEDQKQQIISKIFGDVSEEDIKEIEVEVEEVTESVITEKIDRSVAKRMEGLYLYKKVDEASKILIEVIDDMLEEEFEQEESIEFISLKTQELLENATYATYESVVTEAIDVTGKRDAKKVFTAYKRIMDSMPGISQSKNNNLIKGCIKVLGMYALEDANFHREMSCMNKIKGSISPVEIKVAGLANLAVKVSVNKIKDALQQVTSKVSMAGDWRGIAIAEGTAIYLDSIGATKEGQDMLDMFNSAFESTEELGQKVIEGRAFAAAAKKAKDEGLEEFEFNGKKYPVLIKENTLTESLILEGTRGQFGKIDNRGNITSVYTHYDSYPDNMLPIIKKSFKGGKNVDTILSKGANSGLDSDISKINFYGDGSVASNGSVKRIDKYLQDARDESGAEFVYLWDEKSKKWMMADTYKETGLVPAFESVVNEAKFKKGQYIKAKNDSDNFDGDVYDKTNDVDGSEILKNSSFEIYEIGKDEVILWSDADEVEYSIDPDDLKNFVKESVVNEAKAVKVTKKEWPYVEFKIGSTKHKVEFDYEDIIDDHGNEGQDQYWLGKDDDGKEWSIDVYADYNGDVQDVHYDTIVAESVVTDKPSWDNLLEEFEIVETTNEDIRSDVKKWIRTNKEELNDLADADEWDAMYDKLYSEFGVEADSIKAKDLLKTFQFVF